MSNAPTKEEAEKGFATWTDNDADPNAFYVSIPIKSLAEDKDFGTVILRGYLEEQIKGMALAMIKAKRLKAAGKVLTPSGNGGKPPILTVH